MAKKIELPGADKYIPIGQNEQVSLYFPNGGYMKTGDGDRFNPTLDVSPGQLIPPGTRTTHSPAKGSENSDVLFCFTESQPMKAACTDPIINPGNLAGHIIHIGSGGSSSVTRKDIIALKAAFEAVGKTPDFAGFWPAAKSLIVSLLNVKPSIPSRFRVVLQILAMTGDQIFLRRKEPK